MLIDSLMGKQPCLYISESSFFPHFLKKAFLPSPELINLLKMEICIVPITYYIYWWICTSVCQVVYQYFASTIFLFSQIKLKNNSITVFFSAFIAKFC